METKKTKTIVVWSLLILAGLAVVFLPVYAGNLEPSAPPGPTMHTLEEVYTLTEEIADSTGQVSGPYFAGDDRWVASMRVPGGPTNWYGSYTIGGVGNCMKVIDIRHNVDSNLVPLITVTMNIDKPSGYFWRYFIEGPFDRDFLISFYKSPSDTSAYYSITLYDPITIKRVAQRLVYKGNGQFSHLEEVDLQYSKIKWEYAGGQTYTWTP